MVCLPKKMRNVNIYFLFVTRIFLFSFRIYLYVTRMYLVFRLCICPYETMLKKPTVENCFEYVASYVGDLLRCTLKIKLHLNMLYSSIRVDRVCNMCTLSQFIRKIDELRRWKVSSGWAGCVLCCEMQNLRNILSKPDDAEKNWKPIRHIYVWYVIVCEIYVYVWFEQIGHFFSSLVSRVLPWYRECACVMPCALCSDYFSELGELRMSLDQTDLNFVRCIFGWIIFHSFLKVIGFI